MTGLCCGSPGVLGLREQCDGVSGRIAKWRQLAMRASISSDGCSPGKTPTRKTRVRRLRQSEWASGTDPESSERHEEPHTPHYWGATRQHEGVPVE
jgi:hypothetical protein